MAAAPPAWRRLARIVPQVALIQLVGVGLLAAYSVLNLLPDLPPIARSTEAGLLALVACVAVMVPTGAAWWLLRPLRQLLAVGPVDPSALRGAGRARRGANLPVALALATLLSWCLLVLPALARGWLAGGPVPLSGLVHLALRPVLVGVVAGTAVLFVVEAACRATVWPMVLRQLHITDDPLIWRFRTRDRLLALWLVISVIPLVAVALTTYARAAGADLSADPLLGRIVAVVLLIALSGAVGGAVLAWAVTRSITRPLQALEEATQALSAGRFDTRLVVNATDEFGTLAEGFNLAAERLLHSYADLEARNRELAMALERVHFLEHVKHALDRFVPDTVRHAIEQNPDAPRLAKEARDVTVLFLDIEGYSRLSEHLPRHALNALVERYFSLFLEVIRAEGGDINETAGDGLMILFQGEDPRAHAAAALRAALAVRRRTAEANRLADPAQEAVRINIGIGSGECDVGATRFQGPAGDRWTFTASGPVTNLAARLSDFARGGQILLSAETAHRLDGRFVLRSLGTVQLRNLSGEVPVWEVPQDEVDAGPSAV
ncbi:MAG: adenylate/guanylate cyclase domain-containing protein [Rhodoferax sp.]